MAEEAVSSALAQRPFVPVVAIAVESAKWFLIVGSAFGVVVGAMLLFYPNADRFYASVPGEVLLLGCGISIVFGYWLMLRVGEVPHVRRLVRD